MVLQKEIIQTLNQEVKIALGCTEPVAIALAVALATHNEKNLVIQKIRLGLSPNIYKNALNVGIPGTTLIGLEIAAALGVFCDAEKGLTLLKTLDAEGLASAQVLVDNHLVDVYLMDVVDRIYLRAEIIADRFESLAEVKGKHDGLTLLRVNGETLYEAEPVQTAEIQNALYAYPLEKIVEGVESLAFEDISFLLKGIDVNLQAAALGLKIGSGLGVGQKMQTAIEKGYLGLDLANETLMMTAAASDARMSGDDVEIMTSNGSGNNGITAILPLAVYAMKHQVSQEKLAKALAISHLVNGKIKNAIGRLSPMCACGVAAATGASVGLVYLMDGSFSEMENAIQAMLSNLSGMICDGAKVGCSLKLATSASTAVQTAIFARGGLVLTKGNGILGSSADTSIAHLGRVAIEGMANMDRTILSIMSQ